MKRKSIYTNLIIFLAVQGNTTHKVPNQKGVPNEFCRAVPTAQGGHSNEYKLFALIKYVVFRVKTLLRGTSHLSKFCSIPPSVVGLPLASVVCSIWFTAHGKQRIDVTTSSVVSPLIPYAVLSSHGRSPKGGGGRQGNSICFVKYLTSHLFRGRQVQARLNTILLSSSWDLA